MHKVVRRVINHRYTAIKPAFLVEESVIDFDCFIKRFDDFVIIIESGTFITVELAHKVKQNDKIYILTHDSEKVQLYKKMHGVNEYDELPLKNVRQVALSVMDIKEKIESLPTYEEKLETVYAMSAVLLKSIFEERDETLPLEAINLCIELMVRCINSIETDLMPKVLRLMPDEYSNHHHSTNVAVLSIILAKSIGLSQQDLLDLAYVGLLHDIGKMRIDQKILNKSSTLDDEEYRLIQAHSEYGVEILQNNGIVDQKILDGVRYHHEKLDGKGYPGKLRGKRIPKFARIIGMCDVFDALTTRRTYRFSYTSYEALMVMKQEMEDQFDVHYSDTFIRLLASSSNVHDRT